MGLTMTVDVIATIAIVGLAGAWAGRRLWRHLRRSAAASATAGCVDQRGGCGNCSLGREATDAATPTPSCEDASTRES
jgi:hypothetical protein